MDLSIIIVNWNTRHLLRDCLKSVYEQRGNIKFEVIVVDNASTDNSVEMVRSEFPEVIALCNATNRGFAVANNHGIKIACGRYVLLLNSDTIVCDAAVEKIVQYADKHLEAAVVGCQVWENSDTIQITCFRFPSVVNLLLSASGLAKIFEHNRFLGREWMRWWGRDSERQVDVVSGMFMLVRREAIEEVGVMDEAFFMYFEDTDWCYRFMKAGWKVLFWPGAKIIHVGGGSHSSKQTTVEMFIQKQKSMLTFFKKNTRTINYLLARLILMFSCGLRVFIYTILFIARKITSKLTESEIRAVRKNWVVLKLSVFGLESYKI